MKSHLIWVLIAGSLVVSGCSSEPKKEASQAAVNECVFPGSDQAAPAWVCDAPVEGVAVSAVGIAEPSKAGISFMKDMAAADARGRLAEQLKVRVEKMVKRYLGSTGTTKAEVVDKVASSTTKTITDQTLIGSKVLKSVMGPNGRLYVLVGLDKASVAKITEQAVRTSMKHQSALWQQFKAKQSFDEMAKEIAQQPVQ